MVWNPFIFLMLFGAYPKYLLSPEYVKETEPGDGNSK